MAKLKNSYPKWLRDGNIKITAWTIRYITYYKEQCVFTIYGDMGAAIAYWYNPLELIDSSSSMYFRFYLLDKVQTRGIYI